MDREVVEEYWVSAGDWRQQFNRLKQKYQDDPNVHVISQYMPQEDRDLVRAFRRV